MHDQEHLKAALCAAVPLYIEEFRKLTEEERHVIAKECCDLITEHGDDILYRGPKTKEAFNALAQGIACLAFAPGGVCFVGMCFNAAKKTS